MSEQTEPTRLGRGEKTRAVHLALEELGQGATPTQVREHLAGKGIAITTTHISNIKAKLHGGGKRRTTASRTETPTTTPTDGTATPRFVLSVPAGTISLTDIEATKQLALRLGSEQLHRLIDLLA